MWDTRMHLLQHSSPLLQANTTLASRWCCLKRHQKKGCGFNCLIAFGNKNHTICKSLTKIISPNSEIVWLSVSFLTMAFAGSVGRSTCVLMKRKLDEILLMHEKKSLVKYEWLIKNIFHIFCVWSYFQTFFCSFTQTNASVERSFSMLKVMLCKDAYFNSFI